MRAWLIDKLDGIGGLRLTEVPDPSPGANEVVLQVHYAALNPADRYLAESQYPAKPALPHILGRDGMGTVVAAGCEATGVAVGDRRALLRGEAGGNRPGTFAQRVAVPAHDLIEIPAGWSEAEAAGATLVYLTAYQALTMWGPLSPSSVVLVTGASGGVGVATVQLAAAMGHKVVALSRSLEKRRRLEELGAAATFDPLAPKWRLDLKSVLAPHRVDLAVDNIGGKLLPEVIETLGEHGRVSVVGRLAGPVPSFNTATLFFRRIRLGGVAVGAWTNAESRTAWQEVVSLLSRVGARPQVDKVFPLEQLPQAFERLAQGPMGKVVLAVGTSVKGNFYGKGAVASGALPTP
ncbi:MAG TPA: SDR family NAD(P)-dependent oxidoreductase [Candidatus Paceibacterota bacterium]|nr:SDR family NAD(P)-dependent oxidoreductase [Verrucomicrobiota bacterium]HSA10417.1 SDR family NAD(P)-dependent oxidoreductase [Candidatus Paceibacterota bacterium]